MIFDGINKSWFVPQGPPPRPLEDLFLLTNVTYFLYFKMPPYSILLHVFDPNYKIHKI